MITPQLIGFTLFARASNSLLQLSGARAERSRSRVMEAKCKH
jgi:hypothetical protein